MLKAISVYVLTFVSAASLGLLLMASPGCAANKPPAGMPSNVVRAWYGTEIIHDLDRVRDVANDAHSTAPPLLSAADTLKVVEWHQAAITIVHDAKAGWEAALQSAIDQFHKTLPTATWQLIAPYVQLVQNILKEVKG